MKRNPLSRPVVIAIAATRALLGAGAGLLLAPRLRDKKRRKLGLALMGVGIASTIPLARIVVGATR
jgi:hypothetical protein